MFKKAKRIQAKLKIALTGPSGSGKTYSALKLAKGFGGKIAVIDTENGSASLYSDLFDFDVTEISPPYSTDKYIAAILAAVKAGYDILIIDSLSHQWRGEGGILNKKEQMDARGGNSFTNWGKLTPEQERFMSSLLHSPIHIICTMRSKQEYVLSENSKGKMEPKKVGLAPIQREGTEYEFTTVLDIGMDHQAETSKDRTGLFVDKVFKVDEQTGEALKTWLDSGEVVASAPPQTEPVTTAPPSAPQTKPVSAPKEPTVDTDPGAYKITYGQKYKDKRLDEIDIYELDRYVEWLQGAAKEKGEPLRGSAADLVKHAEAYIASREVTPKGFEEPPAWEGP